MRIDSNHSGQTASASSQPAAAAPIAGCKTASSGEPSVKLSGSLNEDQARLSDTQVLAQALAAEATPLLEERQEKVSALRQAVQSGDYRPDPELVADALFSHLGVNRSDAAVETDWRASQEWATAM
jgi:flagellar biosynthesis anti-sigma factor FlgM